MTDTLDGGFADLVLDGQAVFKAIMNGLARPGTIQTLAGLTRPPAPLTAELAAVALALVDHDTPLWLDATLAGDESVTAWLRFHTGAPLVERPGDAAFALIARPGAMPALDDFAQGSDEYPDRSATLVLALPALDGGVRLGLSGPGIAHHARLSPPGLPDDFVSQWQENGARFPRGVDCLLVAPGRLAGLPRTLRIAKE